MQPKSKNLFGLPWSVSEDGIGLGRELEILDCHNRPILSVEGWSGIVPDLPTALRIVACVNACSGLPVFNGSISIIADMKAAILTRNPEMLDRVEERLREILEHDE